MILVLHEESDCEARSSGLIGMLDFRRCNEEAMTGQWNVRVSRTYENQANARTDQRHKQKHSVDMNSINLQRQRKDHKKKKT
jgi:hypothetical protein